MLCTPRITRKLADISINQLRTCCQADSPCTSGTKQLILSNTVVKTKPLVPEIKLHLIDKTCSWYHQTSVPELLLDPFWAIFWPGGQVLSRFVLDNQSVVKGRGVIDVGCGCGALGVAASLSGAAHVVCNDIDGAAIHAVQLNCRLNSIHPQPSLSTDNILTNQSERGNSDHVTQTNQSEPSNSDHVTPTNQSERSKSVFFLGDMFYEESFARSVLKWCQSHQDEVYIGDPGRWGLDFVKEFIEPVAEYRIDDEDCQEYRSARVYRFIK